MVHIFAATSPDNSPGIGPVSVVINSLWICLRSSCSAWHFSFSASGIDGPSFPRVTALPRRLLPAR